MKYSKMQNITKHVISTQHIICIFCFLILSILFPLMADELPRDILSHAMYESLNTSYSCAVEDNELLSATGAVRGTFWRLVLEDGFVCRKIELYDTTGKAIVIYTQNRRGSYAFAGDEWAKVADIMPLWHFDYIASDLDDFEKSICTYSKRIINFAGENMQEIRLDTTEDMKKLEKGGNSELPLWGEDGSDDLYSSFYAKRPMHRIFLIEPKTHFIISRTHYNVRNQKLLDRKIKDLILSPDITEKDFAPSGAITRDYIWLHEQFMNKYFGDIYASKQKTLPDSTYYTPSLLERFDSWLFDSGKDTILVWVLRIGGILCLGVIGIVYWRRRKQ